MSFPERIVPEDTEPGVVALHLKRYEFALPYCESKDVLDAGCGVGYGSAYLAQVARRVVGVDVDDGALAYARERYGAPNVSFERHDLQRLELPDASFDVVCSFEAIEHLDDPAAFLEHAARVLRPGGVLVASTPHVPETSRDPENPYHRFELSRPDFERLLRRFFRDVELYGQRRLQTARHRFLRRADVLGLRRRLPFLRRAARLTGTPPTEAVALDDIAISRDGIERATELVAVCRA